MTALEQSKTMSMEAFLRMPGNEHHEWIHGEAIPIAETPLDHAVIIGNVAYALRRFIEDNPIGVVGTESAHYLVEQDDGSEAIRMADVSFIATDNPKQTVRNSPHPGSPDLAVEVVSAWDTYAAVMTKTHMWLSNGARMVWVVSHDQHVTIHRPGEPSIERFPGQQLEGFDVLPGFACDVEALYP